MERARMCVRALLPLIRPRSARLYIIQRSYCSPLSQTSLLAVHLKIRLFLHLLFSLTRHLTVPLFTVKNFSPSCSFYYCLPGLGSMSSPYVGTVVVDACSGELLILQFTSPYPVSSLFIVCQHLLA